MSLMDGFLSRFMPTRKGKYVCGCQEVQFRVSLPPSSYGIIKQPCLACHCSDCFGFADALYQGSTKNTTSRTKETSKSTSTTNNCIDVIDRSTNSVALVNCYTSDYEIVKGHQYVKKIRLRETSDATRFYCSRCRTPLALESSIMSFLYPMLFQSTTAALPPSSETEKDDSSLSWLASLPSYIPSVAVFYKDAPVGTMKRKGIVTRHGPIAPLFLVRVIGRLILGLLFGKGQTGGMSSLLIDEPLPIGMPGQEEDGQQQRRCGKKYQ